MIGLRNWITIIVLSLPFSWIIAYLSMIRSYGLDNLAIFAAISLFVGLWVGGILADIVKRHSYLLIGMETVPLLVGLIQLVLPQTFFSNLLNLIMISCLLFFFFGASIVVMTIFLNRIASCTHRGRVGGVIVVTILGLGGVFSILWHFMSTIQNLISGICAFILLIGLLIFTGMKPWRGELRTYLVPGSIKPYIAWWFIYIAAFLLYSLATPLGDRFLFQGFTIFGSSLAWTELVLIGVGGAAIAFAFLPDWLGRKKVFSIASVLLGELCIFADAR
ncbi:MAG: hypothetical protein ACFFDP_05085, partial [Promethearchaeota archaeon]